MTSLLKQLPAAPSGKKGWPWTVESTPLSPTMQNGDHWPKITIVTPSYNQGHFIEETIRSVLLQNYPRIEYIIMDGGSSDDSLEIIKKYSPWLKHWVSQEDKGQADAIHQGFKVSTGEIIAWINSDDYYMKNAFKTVAKQFSNNQHIEMLAGACRYLKYDGKIISKNYGLWQDYFSILNVGMFCAQPSMFWRSSVYHDVGGLNKQLHFCMDYDLLLKFYQRKPAQLILKELAAYRFHNDTKSANIQNILAEEDFKLGQVYGRISDSDKLVKIKNKYWSKYKKRQFFLQASNIFIDPIFGCKYIAKFIFSKISLILNR